MRASCRLLLFALSIAMCAPAHAADRIFRNSFENPVDCVVTPNDPECPTFTIATPEATIPPGVVTSTCYYFRAPNTSTAGLSRLEATLNGGTAYIVLWATFAANGSGAPAEREPPGTFSSAGCGDADSNGTTARRVWQAHRTGEALEPPANDGTGRPVAIEWLAGQPLFIQIVAPNVTDQPINASAAIGAQALPVATLYTRTDTFFTFNGNINIAAMSSGSATQACDVPAGVKFWHFTTHTHGFATSATLSTFPSLQTLVVTSDWENPAIQEFPVAPFFDFAGEKLRYSCNYTNNGTTPVQTGSDELNDENCVAISYFFPATKPRLCFNSILIP